jgi:transcriptional regulator GlxA family with amidase domain
VQSLSFSTLPAIPPAPESHTEAVQRATIATFEVRDAVRDEVGSNATSPSERPPVLPQTMQRLVVARQRIHEAAITGQRIRTYEVALDLDMSEFHFARQFRLAFDRSPHVYYDEVRADTARGMLGDGLAEGTVARRIGFRRPAELRALLGKRPAGTLPPDLR